MITNELLEYIKRHQELRTPSEEMNANLAKQGWSPADIQEAIATLQNTKSLEKPKGCLVQAFEAVKMVILVFLIMILIGYGVCLLLMRSF